MARDPASLIDAPELDQVDLFGFSMGGFVAQQIAVDRPDLVRRLILVGTGPRGGEGMDRLATGVKKIHHATLVVNGSNDIVVPTVNSYILQQNLPNAELILFPDSNHGSHFQFPKSFNQDVTDFLERHAPSQPPNQAA